MCLTLDASKTSQKAKSIVDKKFNQKEKSTFWKILRKCPDQTLSSCDYYVCTSWEKGITTKSNRITTVLSGDEKTNKDVNFGIHVFLTRKDARNHKRGFPKYFTNTKIYKVICNKKDLIATGTMIDCEGVRYPTAAFMQAKLF